jgi:hypothetical protein
MKLNFVSSAECHSHIFYIPKTQDGIDETQLPFEFKVSLVHLYTPKTQDGIDETQLPFEFKVTFIYFTSGRLKME